MEETDRQTRVRELLEKRATRLGISSVTDLLALDRPNWPFSQMDSSVQANFLDALSANISKAVAEASAIAMPTADCLLPSEADHISKLASTGQTLPPEVESHIADCVFCRTALGMNQEVSFVQRLRDAVTERAGHSTDPSTATQGRLESPEWLSDNLGILLDGSVPINDILETLRGHSDPPNHQDAFVRSLASLLRNHPVFYARNSDEFPFVDTRFVGRAFELARGLPANEELYTALLGICPNPSLIGSDSIPKLFTEALFAQLPEDLFLSSFEQILDESGIRLGALENALERLIRICNRHSRPKSFELLFRSLGSIASILEEESPLSRRQDFSKVLGRVLAVHGEHNDWQAVVWADKYGWPAWAVQCLPRLFLSRQLSQSTPRIEALAWKPLAYVMLQKLPSSQLESLCKGEVLRMVLPRLELAIFSDLGKMLDAERQEYIYQSEKACNVAATSILRNAASARYSNLPELALNITKASFRVLQEEGIGSTLAATSGL